MVPEYYGLYAYFAIGMAVMYLTKADDTVTVPREEAILGERTKLRCDFSVSDKLDWRHIRVKESLPGSVYTEHRFVGEYTRRYSLGEIDGYHALVIDDTQRQDAGKYICENMHQTENNTKTIELIVLESAPMCNSSQTTSDLVGDNDCGLTAGLISITCSVKYFGNINPVLNWSDAEDVSGTSRVLDRNYTLSNTLNARIKWNQFIYTCRSMSPYHQPCYFVTAKPSYVFNTSNEIILQWPQLVTCLANSSQSCSYRWYKDDSVIVNHPALEFFTESLPGVYRCEAECQLGGKSCKVRPLSVNFHYSPNNQSTDEGQSAAGYILTVVITAVLVAFLMRLYKIRELWERLMRNAVQRTDDLEILLYEETSCEDLKWEEAKASLMKCVQIEARVNGITVLEKLIYIVRFGSNVIESYIKNNSDLQVFDSIHVPDLKEPRDLVSCRRKNILYVSDRVGCFIIKISIKQIKTDRWSTTTKPEGLSVTSKTHVLAACPAEHKLREFKSNGEPVREVTLYGDNINHLHHAVEMKNGYFLVCFGDESDPTAEEQNRVDIFMPNGKFTGKKYDGSPRPDGEQAVKKMWPMRVAQIRHGYIIVAAYNYQKILLLNPEMEYVKDLIISADDYLPSRMFFDVFSNELFISEHCTDLKHSKISYYALENGDAVSNADPSLENSVDCRY